MPMRVRQAEPASIFYDVAAIKLIIFTLMMMIDIYDDNATPIDDIPHCHHFLHIRAAFSATICAVGVAFHYAFAATYVRSARRAHASLCSTFSLCARYVFFAMRAIFAIC